MAKPADTYKSLSTELDEVVDLLQSGDLDIDQAAEAYQKGIDLIERLERHLKSIENKVSKIKQSFDKK